jgi:hypothetical protein
VADVGDPWARLARHARALGPRAKKLDALLAEAGADTAP